MNSLYKNHILITIDQGPSSPTEEIENIISAKKTSKKIINKLRSYAGINIETGEFRDYFKNDERLTPVYHYFSHMGYIKKNEPKNKAANINDMIRIRTKVPYLPEKITSAEDAWLLNYIYCEGALEGKEILCVEKKYGLSCGGFPVLFNK